MTTPGPHRSMEVAVPHYYGDIVRILMLSGVGLALVSVPFSHGFIHDLFIVEVLVALVIVVFAAMTNPFKSSIILGDVILSGIAVALFEIDAFNNYTDGELVTFVIYEAIAILFVIAFYFSLKTLRAFTLHQIGRENSSNDFEASAHGSNDKHKNPLEAEEAYKPDFLGD
jgi:hypothetical protein